MCIRDSINAEYMGELSRQTTSKVKSAASERVNRASLMKMATLSGDKKKPKINPELECLLAMVSEKFSFDGLSKVWGISSIDEDKILKLAKSNERGLVDFHKRFFSRIYPRGTRVDSSNFSPMESWIYGSQVVALNFQTKDEAMLLNKAKFEENGGVTCGYVLKPEFMLSSGNSPAYPSDFNRVLKTLKIKVISGQQLRFESRGAEKKDIVDPYVKVSIRGLKQDEKTKETKLIEDNGFNPIWNDSFEFQIHGPDFAILKFEVFDKDRFGSTRIGWYAVPFNVIRDGYRIVQLLNSQLDPIPFSVLLVHISTIDHTIVHNDNGPSKE
eukprot:TRINITY_DN9620_c0_g1_i2.p1 TRINITY_DN9620_c0_g1~~TRINITY_DN9620_c0_g1_i2.p1  ORF type:complete len:346 (-),score=86.03 TRINITY_DN9620_c0_g1_i2:19-999(-)